MKRMRFSRVTVLSIIGTLIVITGLIAIFVWASSDGPSPAADSPNSSPKPSEQFCTLNQRSPQQIIDSLSAEPNKSGRQLIVSAIQLNLTLSPASLRISEQTIVNAAKSIQQNKSIDSQQVASASNQITNYVNKYCPRKAS